MMLREGWDVRNVTTIVPLRPYSSKANILPEQTLGRGLRRITPPGQALETVTVVEHPAFVRLYQDELEQESAFLPDIPIEYVPRTTVSIFPDPKKDWDKLKIAYPALTDAYRVVSTLESISIDEVKAALNKLSKLELGQPREVELDYEGRSLVTNEVIENMKVRLPLLQNGIGAISYYREELENICHIRNTHAILAPVLETFLTELLFNQKVDLFDPRLVARLGDSDVREYVRAVFVPIINSKTKLKQERLPLGADTLLSQWKPYQVTASEHHPVIQAERTLFNLVPCNRSLERTFASFADIAEDVIAFAKNDGPQALRIDYEGSQNRHAFYTPDFFVRTISGKYFLVETKGEMEPEVFAKVKAATAWCKSASETGTKWEYLFVPEDIFKQFNDTSIESLSRACTPEITRLLQDAEKQIPSLPFYQISETEKQAQREVFIKQEDFDLLREKYQRAILEASELFSILQTKELNFAPCFTSLLSPIDDASIRLIFALLKEYVPTSKAEQDRFFMPDYSFVSEVDKKHLMNNGAALKKALVYNSYMMPISLLCFCLEYARKTPSLPVDGIFTAIQQEFSRFNNSQLFERLDHIREFRNKYVAHGHLDTKLTVEEAKVELKNWVSGLSALQKAIRVK
jgi:type III restriction enzyme